MNLKYCKREWKKSEHIGKIDSEICTQNKKMNIMNIGIDKEKKNNHEWMNERLRWLAILFLFK